MSGGEKRKIFSTPPLQEGRAPEVQVVRDQDVPVGQAAPVPSPSVIFRHSGPSLPGAQRTAPAPPPAAPDQTPQADPPAADTRPPPPAEAADLAHLSRDEIREIRKEERRLKRVMEGRAPAQPGDPVPGAPPTLKQKKEAKKKSKNTLQDIRVAPVAPAAQMRERHLGVLLSLGLMVFLPLMVVGWYMSTRAVDQYASTAGFTVRSEEGVTGAVLSGIAASLSGGSTQTDTDILYEFIQSQSLVNSIDDKFDLRALYSVYRDKDPIFSLDPEATAEDLLEYWSRIVSVSYDQSSGLMEMRVQAFEAKTPQMIAQAVLAESQALINALNAQARADKLRYGEIDLEEARQRLRAAREALILFRTRTQIVDPETDLQGRLGVVNSLQQQLAEALIEQDLLREQTNANDPRVLQVSRKIDVIRDRISEERASVSSGDASMVGGEAYPELLAEYEGLEADRQFTEETYRAALVAYDVAKANASRQSRYLASYIQPTLPQTAEYPKRWLTFGLACLFLMLVWSVVVLIYYSIRDSK